MRAGIQRWLRPFTGMIPFLVALFASACTEPLESHRTQSGATSNPSNRRDSVLLTSQVMGRAVGKAHSEMINDFRAALRKPGVLTRSICTYLAAFSTRTYLPEKHGRLRSQEAERIAKASLQQSPLCQPNIASQNVALVAISPLPHLLQAGTAEDLRLRTEQAIDLATGSDDLAVRLSQIRSEAAALEPVGRDVVNASSSVAEDSYSYWTSNYPAFEQEVAAEYGPCAEYYAQQGYTSTQAFNVCVNSEFVETGAFLPEKANAAMKHASALQSCATVTPQTVNALIKADLNGAFAGGYAGAFTGGLAGIFPGALIGGSGSSIAYALGKAWLTYWCIMTRPRRGTT